MKNKDIMEWMLDEGIDPLTTVTTDKGEMYLSDILTKHLTEQLRQHFVSKCNADNDKLVECSNCGDKVEMISSGEFCPHCFCC
jgi:hypothetical protein